MKHLKLFNDAASYEAWKNSEDYVLPNVIFSEETGVVYEAVKSHITYVDDTIYEHRKEFYELCMSLYEKAGNPGWNGFYGSEKLYFDKPITLNISSWGEEETIEYVTPNMTGYFAIKFTADAGYDWVYNIGGPETDYMFRSDD